MLKYYEESSFNLESVLIMQTRLDRIYQDLAIMLTGKIDVNRQDNQIVIQNECMLFTITDDNHRLQLHTNIKNNVLFKINDFLVLSIIGRELARISQSGYVVVND